MGTTIDRATVRRIRRRVEDGETQTAVARDLGIGQPVVSRIVNGSRRRRVPDREGRGTAIPYAAFVAALVATAWRRKDRAEAIAVVPRRPAAGGPDEEVARES